MPLGLALKRLGLFGGAASAFGLGRLDEEYARRYTGRDTIETWGGKYARAAGTLLGTAGAMTLLSPQARKGLPMISMGLGSIVLGSALWSKDFAASSIVPTAGAFAAGAGVLYGRGLVNKAFFGATAGALALQGRYGAEINSPLRSAAFAVGALGAARLAVGGARGLVGTAAYPFRGAMTRAIGRIPNTGPMGASFATGMQSIISRAKPMPFRLALGGGVGAGVYAAANAPMLGLQDLPPMEPANTMQMHRATSPMLNQSTQGLSLGIHNRRRRRYM